MIESVNWGKNLCLA